MYDEFCTCNNDCSRLEILDLEEIFFFAFYNQKVSNYFSQIADDQDHSRRNEPSLSSAPSMAYCTGLLYTGNVSKMHI